MGALPPSGSPPPAFFGDMSVPSLFPYATLLRVLNGMLAVDSTCITPCSDVEFGKSTFLPREDCARVVGGGAPLAGDSNGGVGARPTYSMRKKTCTECHEVLGGSIYVGVISAIHVAHRPAVGQKVLESTDRKKKWACFS